MTPEQDKLRISSRQELPMSSPTKTHEYPTSMATPGHEHAKPSYYFLLWWVLAVLTGSPALLAPPIVFFALLAFGAIVSDGSEIGREAYLEMYLISALTGAIAGTWLGLLQWLVLRKHLVKSGWWIMACALGTAIASPFYSNVFMDFFMYKSSGEVLPNSTQFYLEWSGLIGFALTLGFALSVPQWLVLRLSVDQAEVWILALPLSFILVYVFAGYVRYFPVLIAVGLISGGFLYWLLSSNKKQQ